MLFLLYTFRVGVSCRIFLLLLYVSGSGSITSVGEDRALELICLLLFTFNLVFSVPRGFLFLWVLGMDCVIIL